MTQTKTLKIARKLKERVILWKYLVFIFILGILFAITVFHTETAVWGKMIPVGLVILFGIGIRFMNDIHKLR